MPLANETKVGLLALVALGGLAWLSIQSGTILSGTSGGRTLSSVFTSVDGITIGSPVKMAGVQVGEVESITLQPNGTATLSFKVKSDVPLSSSMAVKIDTSGIIGERFVALVPGTDAATPLPAATTTLPSLGGGNGDVSGNFGAVSDDLKQITNTLRTVLGNEENVAKIQQIIDGLASFSGSLENDSGSIIADLKVASASLKDILAGGDAAETKNMIANFSKVAANMASITDKLERGEGPLGELINGGGGAGGGALADLSGAMKDFRETMAKINSGDGTLGKLVNDKEMATKLENAIATFGDASERINRLQTELSFEGASLVAENGIGNSGVQLVVRPQGPASPHFYVGGASFDGFANRADDKDDPTSAYFGKEFGNDTKYTLQYGRFFPQALPGTDVAVRVGMKNSTGGLGVDATRQVLGRQAQLSADLYDFSGSNMPDGDTPQLDVKARVNVIGKTVYGVVGYDNLLNQEYGSPVVGAGVRFVDEDLKYLLGQAL